MEKEQYLKLKEDQTFLSAEIKGLRMITKKGWKTKGIIDPDKRTYWYDSEHPEYQMKMYKKSSRFRAMHIFLCLCRGRTREQIENNFEKQNAGYADIWDLEIEIAKLCEKYNLKIDLDEKRRVLSVERYWIKQKVV